MAGISIFDHQVLDAGYPEVFCTARGEVRSSRFAPPESSIWAVTASMAPGAELAWTDEHGDEAIHVLEGTVETGEGQCGAGDSIVVEAGVPTTLRAVTDARILHYGSSLADQPGDGLFGAPDADGHRVHRVPQDDAAMFSHDLADGRRIQARYFADSSCPTCRLTLLQVSGPDGVTIPSHVHSQDELIHVVEGALHSGSLTVPAGSTVFIAGGHRYGLRADEGFSFVNYRRDVSTYVGNPREPALLETIAAARERHAASSGAASGSVSE